MKRLLDDEQVVVADRLIDELNTLGSTERGLMVLLSIVAATLNHEGDGGAMSQLAAQAWSNALMEIVIEGQQGELATNAPKRLLQ